MKKLMAIGLCLVFIFQSAFAATDDRIFTDPVQNTYPGRTEAPDLISALNFSDVAADYWAGEAIARGGALKMISGYGGTYQPGSYVSNEEALAFIIRMMGRTTDALNAAAGPGVAADYRDLWSIGYILLARNTGIITNADYGDIMREDLVLEGVIGEPEPNPNYRTATVTREKLALWLARAMSEATGGDFIAENANDKLFTFGDWQNVGGLYAPAVDAVASAGIMKGDNLNMFNPKAGLTRAEMAQVLRNMDEIYYQMAEIVRKTGTVGGFRDNYGVQTGSSGAWRNYYIRTAQGTIDVIQYQISQNSLDTPVADVVVFKEGRVRSLGYLEEGDQIEYLASTATGEALYIQVIEQAPVVMSTAQGTLYSFNPETGSITLQDSEKRSYVFNLSAGIYTEEYLVIDNKRVSANALPIGSTLLLNLKNQTVDTINFVGQPILVEELRGIVVENDPQYGYLTFVDNFGNLLTKNYYEGAVKVKKQQYYEMNDEIGYLNQVFPNFKYNPWDSEMSQIEPGDIVFMRFSPDDPELISEISAATNYAARYGQIRQITYGEAVSRYLVEFENKQTTWFDVANAVYVSKEGRPILPAAVQIGDWAKFLVNQAIISPGYVMESVKEINIEGSERHISNIVKGQLSGIEPIQKTLVLQNAQTLEKTGWGSYRNLQQFSLAGTDIEYYYNDQRISLDYANKFLKRSEGEVYVALENSASGERIKKVTFRMGRDQFVDPDTVLSADGNGNFLTIGKAVSTDSGTIVRRYGRLVDGSAIMASDYTTISLNGGSTAAVVDITDTPGVSNILIARARILSVDEGNSFKTQSMSMLAGTSWVYTPIQREFSIDYNTMFFGSGGVTNLDSFIDYTESSVADKVYTVVYEGSRALRVYDAPYAQEVISGKIYAVNGNSVSMQNVRYLNRQTNVWHDISLTNPTLTVTLQQNSVIGKNNQLITANGLTVGDEVKVLTNSLPSSISPTSNINAYILLVEK